MVFKAETALKVVKKKKGNDENLTHPNTPISKLYKDYFSIETGDPIPLDQISNRVKKRFCDLDRTHVSLCLDLFFLHRNWKNFYNREDSFTKYLKEDLKISKTHAYGIINSVDLLSNYFSHRGKDAPELDVFINEISSSIESVGISKLIIIAAIKSEKQKYSLVEKLIRGESITTEELLNKSKPKKRANIKTEIILKGDQLFHKDEPILEFKTENIQLRKVIQKAIVNHCKKAGV